eukprot:scaffold1828_cov258-Pinguiococcus_pyrenoidosus.AAC.4
MGAVEVFMVAVDYHRGALAAARCIRGACPRCGRCPASTRKSPTRRKEGGEGPSRLHRTVQKMRHARLDDHSFEHPRILVRHVDGALGADGRAVQIQRSSGAVLRGPKT